MKQFAVYTAARLGVFLVSYGAIVAIYLLVTGEDQIPLFWPFLLAVVISAVASVTLLRRQRDAFALAVQQRAERSVRRRRLVEDESRRMAEGGRRSTTEEDEPPAPPEDTGR